MQKKKYIYIILIPLCVPGVALFPWCSSKHDMLLSVCYTACVSLGVSQLDSVIIAPPPLPEGETLTLAHMQPLWAELEKIVQSQKAASIGTSDLDKTQLEELYNWAQVRGGERACRETYLYTYIQY